MGGMFEAAPFVCYKNIMEYIACVCSTSPNRNGILM